MFQRFSSRFSTFFAKPPAEVEVKPLPHQSMFSAQINDTGFGISDDEESQTKTAEVKATGPSTTKKMLAAMLPPVMSVSTQLGLNALAPGLGVIASGLIGCGTQAVLNAVIHHDAITGIDKGSVWESVSRMASSFGVGAGFGSAAFAVAKSVTGSNAILEAASIGSSVVGQTFFYHRDLSKTNRAVELEQIAADLVRDPLQPRRSISQ